MVARHTPSIRYRRRGGRPELNVDFMAVCDAVSRALNGDSETITAIAERFGVSRGWIHKWVCPARDHGRLPSGRIFTKMSSVDA